MAPPNFHPGNLLALAIDPIKMDAAKPTLDQAITATLSRLKPDMEANVLLISATPSEGKTHIEVEVAALALHSQAMQPVLRTVHLVSSAIFDLVKDKPHDDEAAFDQAVTRATQVLQKNGADPRLAAMLVETAVLAIFVDQLPDAMLMTLYADGRLMLIKGSLLSRQLQAYQREQQRRATAK